MKSPKVPHDSKDKAVDRRMRGLALALIGLAVILIGYVFFVTIRPIYWKIYADLTHESAPVANQELNAKLVQALLRDVGENYCSSPLVHVRVIRLTFRLYLLQTSRLEAVL
jgi:hypothetical protein